jgi:hypothetical protein
MEETLWLWLACAGWSLLCYRLGLNRSAAGHGRPRTAGTSDSGEAAVRRSLERIEGYRGPGKEVHL